ncbi:SDH family Clp fold serine proteinase [Jongsikchunia kroppenstedtii]|uniref:SDH family Clp fold serine proteinase n=1 Tax=Jongsikchunia kroppenstedtii TaxID=1121721 RepID=UPI0012DCB8FB|nr:ATP-dependent Clp protease proteolytic subunit [Jongsikchunia kroppenstedtii]
MQSALNTALAEIGTLRGGRNVILFASAFLQKPDIPGTYLMINNEDINGLMSVIYKMDCSKGLTLILHTPGGVTTAAESVVSYVRTKFTDVEVIVPTFAMSAGTMICLSADRLIMGRQSQLGPIDPQMSVGGGRSMSARAITEQFDRAKREILEDVGTAHVWAPIMQSHGPALLQEAQNALDYSERMVARWLTKGMFREMGSDAESKGKAVAHHFNDASEHKSHGRRIDRDEARQQGVTVEDLEDNQSLQEQVLTAYHLMTIIFTQTPAVKLLWSDAGRLWQKAWTGSQT